MKAAVIREFGSEDALLYEEAPDPTAGPGEIVVGVRAAGLNRGDLGRRLGLNSANPPLPLILGVDVAGEIIEVGSDVSRPNDCCATCWWTRSRKVAGLAH